MIVRLGLPKTTGEFPGAALRLGAPVLVSAGGLWDGKRGRFREPGTAITDLDVALDSAGFVAMKQWGGYPWTVEQYVELALSRPTFSWWSAPDLCCEPELACNVDARVKGTADLLLQTLRIVDHWRKAAPDVYWLHDPMPILQGWTPAHYRQSIHHIGLYLRAMGREWPDLVGVGSVCRRPLRGATGLVSVLAEIDKGLPENVKLHLFGVKGSALAVLAENPRIASVDSLAWDFGARIDARKAGHSSTNAHRIAAMTSWYESSAVAAGELHPVLRDAMLDAPAELRTWAEANPRAANVRYLELLDE